MLSNFESLDDGNNQKTRRLVSVSAFVQWIRGRGRKGKKKSGIILVWTAKQNTVFLKSVDLNVWLQWESQQ